jgi:hypothetical protein
MGSKARRGEGRKRENFCVWRDPVYVAEYGGFSAGFYLI